MLSDQSRSLSVARQMPAPASTAVACRSSSRQSRSLSVARQMPAPASTAVACRAYRTKKRPLPDYSVRRRSCFLRVTTSVTGSLRSLCPVSRIYIPTQFILRFNSFPYNGGIPVRVNQICHPYLSSDSFRPDCSQVIAPLTLLFPRTFRKLSESMLPWESCPVLRFGFFQSAFIISQKSGLSIEN